MKGKKKTFNQESETTRVFKAIKGFIDKNGEVKGKHRTDLWNSLVVAVMNDIKAVSESTASNGAKGNRLTALGEKATKAINMMYNSDGKTLTTVKMKLSHLRKEIRDNSGFHHMYNRKMVELSERGDWLGFAVKNSLNQLLSTPVEAYKAIDNIISRAMTIGSNLGAVGDKAKSSEYNDYISQLKDIAVCAQPYYKMVLSKEQADELKAADKAKREQVHAGGVVTIGIKQVRELSEMLLKSNEPCELALGLALATGRRPSEIFHTAQFKRVGDRFDKLLFKGQIKKKFWQTQGNDGYEIYSLVDCELVTSALGRLRTIQSVADARKVAEKEKSYGVFNRKFALKSGVVAGRYLKMLNDERDWKFTNSRSIWVKCVAHAYFNEWSEKGYSIQGFCKEMLGHDHIATQTDYDVFNIIDSKEFTSAKPDKGSKYVKSPEIEKAPKAGVYISVIELESANEKICGYVGQKPSVNALVRCHGRVLDYVMMKANKHDEALRLSEGVLRRAKKLGGVGIADYVAKAYLELIKEFASDVIEEKENA